MSSFTQHSRNEKRTALKLINKYADSYNNIIQENKSLKTEINDLRSNLRLNKEIIEGFFTQMKHKDKATFCISKYKEENQKLYLQNEQLNKDINALHSKIAFTEQTYSELLNREKEECENVKMQLFLLEQASKKKDNIILHQKKKIDNQKEDDFNFFEKEIYIIDPTKAVVQINDELMLYRQIYENLCIHIQHNKDSLARYEQVITDLQNDNLKLRNQFKMHLMYANKERETLMTVINKERSHSEHRIITNSNYKKESSSSNGNGKQNLTDTPFRRGSNSTNMLVSNKKGKNLIKKLELFDDKSRKFECEEFVEIIKAVGISNTDFDRMSKLKNYSKLTDAIEMMYKLLKDKNMTINLLEKENENLTAKNFQLNKTNMSLFQENLELKTNQGIINKHKVKEHQHLFSNNKSNPSQHDDSSLINNTSKITINQNIENTINTYKKHLRYQINQNIQFNIEQNSCTNEKDSILNSSLENSAHDSIVYTKNIRDEPEMFDESNGNQSVSPKKNNNRTFKKIAAMTLDSVTSSEFREGCQDIESFMSTMKGNVSGIIDSKNNNNNNNNKDNNINEDDIVEINVCNIQSSNI